MSQIKSLAAQAAAVGHLFLDRLKAVVADPSDPAPLRAAALILRRPATVAELYRHKEDIKPVLYSAFDTCLREAVMQNNPTLMHFSTALMATLIEKKVLSAQDLGVLVSPHALETYQAFSVRIPRSLNPKGPVALKQCLAGAPVRKAARVSRDQPIVPDPLAASSLVRGRDKAFSGAAYGGYMLSLLQAVEADLSNTPLLAAAFSAVSWELTRLNQKKKTTDTLPQLPQITQTLVRIATSGLEMQKPLAVHQSLKTITYLWQHDYIERAQFAQLTSSERISLIGKSLTELSPAGYQGRLGVSGQGVFLTQLRNCGLMTCSEHNQERARRWDAPYYNIDTISEPLEKQGVLRAVTVSFNAAARFKRAIPLCQLQVMAQDVGSLAVDAASKNIPSLLSSSVVAMGALMAANKRLRPAFFKTAASSSFVVSAFEKVAKPLLRYPSSEDARHVMRFFEELQARHHLPEVLRPAVRSYKASQRTAEGFV